MVARRVCSSATAKSLHPATTSSTFSISRDLMSQQFYLTQYGLMAEKHWREFRPRMVRGMEKKGTLMEALFEAQETTLDEMEMLTRQMEREQRMTPEQAQTTAWELIREKYILLPPESPND